MIKLGDFGIAKVLSHTIEKARTQVGTPYYLSPEIIQNKPYSFKSDIWSLGVLLYELSALKPPFDGNSIHQLSLNIVRGSYAPVANQYSRDLKNLIGQMLSIDPARRPTMAQILKMNFVKEKIQNFLSETIRVQEFSHTVLHNQNVFTAAEKKKKEEEMQKKNEGLKRNDEDLKKKLDIVNKRNEEAKRKAEDDKRYVDAMKNEKARDQPKPFENVFNDIKLESPASRDGGRPEPTREVPPSRDVYRNRDQKPQVADLMYKIPEYKPKPPLPVFPD